MVVGITVQEAVAALVVEPQEMMAVLHNRRVLRGEGRKSWVALVVR